MFYRGGRLFVIGSRASAVFRRSPAQSLPLSVHAGGYTFPGPEMGLLDHPSAVFAGWFPAGWLVHSRQYAMDHGAGAPSHRGSVSQPCSAHREAAASLLWAVGGVSDLVTPYGGRRPALASAPKHIALLSESSRHARGSDPTQHGPAPPPPDPVSGHPVVCSPSQRLRPSWHPLRGRWIPTGPQAGRPVLRLRPPRGLTSPSRPQDSSVWSRSGSLPARVAAGSGSAPDRFSAQVPGSSRGDGPQVRESAGSAQARAAGLKQGSAAPLQVPSGPHRSTSMIAPGSAHSVRIILGPSGARGLCVRHLRLLGHAPTRERLLGSWGAASRSRATHWRSLL
ncbi:hypothetical protein NDU88_004834 [Pleurodeles waltl]|uniref:Uncharacterized protein n=1 Tax=Pleurodeles waltl TaxID=8319 RepID=A0AAV7M7G0_PLEWA|nr:hypothetical protein NDU88_004834 [Pleurodeles waltl]